MHILHLMLQLTASSANWWLRSPNCNNPQNVANVNTTGGYNNNNANNSNRLSPDCV